MKNKKQNLLNFHMYIFQERLSFLKTDYVQNSVESNGFILIDEKRLTDVIFVTENRILVRKNKVKRIIVKAISKNKKVEIFSMRKLFLGSAETEEQLMENSKANITRLVTSNASLQMFVFEIDKPIGKPAELNSREKQALEEMNAF